MAVWQFKFSFVPKSGVLKQHGSIPHILDEFLPYDGKHKLKETSEYLNYWEEQEVTRVDFDFFESIIPKVDSWDESAIMYEDSEGNRIEVWDDDINCRIDARKFNLSLINNILNYALEKNWLIAITSNGHVITPNIFSFIKEFKLSFSFKFCEDPEKALKGLV